MKSIKKILCVAFAFCMIFSHKLTVAAAENENETNLQESKLYAQSAVLMDADSGRILYSKSGDERKPMASTTKIMTCIIALENAELDSIVTVSRYAASMPDVQLNMKTGEQFILKDLLYSLMLESHNDSAVAIAEYVGGNLMEDGKREEEGNLQKEDSGQREAKSQESSQGIEIKEATKEESQERVLRFADEMNEKAKEIGCKNTHFITPNGLDATETFTDESGNSVTIEHSTTAEDLARIMSYCILKSPKKEEFLEITRTGSYQFTNMIVDEGTGSAAKGNRTFSCNNHNAFLTMMDGALSGKTGFTGKAGYCYVGSLQRDGKTLVVALLACGWPNHKTYKWSDTKALMNYGLENYTYHTLEEIPLEEKNFADIPVEEGQTSQIGGVISTPVETVENTEVESIEGLLLKDGEEIVVNYSVASSLEAPVQKGQQVGTVTYVLGDEVLKEMKILAAQDIPRIDITWCIKRVIEKWLAA